MFGLYDGAVCFMQVVTFCQTAAEACIAFGAAEVAPRINAFAAAAGVPETNPKDLSGLQNLLQNFADPFVQYFFPEHAGISLVYCTLMLVAGPQTFHAVLLMMLTAFFRSPNLKLGEFAGSVEHAAVLRTLTLLVEGSNSAQVLALMEIVLSHMAMGDAGAGGRAGEDVRAPLPTELIPVAGMRPPLLTIVSTRTDVSTFDMHNDPASVHGVPFRYVHGQLRHVVAPWASDAPFGSAFWQVNNGAVGDQNVVVGGLQFALTCTSTFPI